MQTLWKIMDGRKTYTGIAVMVITILMTKVSQDDATIMVDIIFNILGAVLTIVGLVHKLVKAYNAE